MATLTQFSLRGAAKNLIKTYPFGVNGGDIQFIGGGRFLFTKNLKVSLNKLDGTEFRELVDLIDLGTPLNTDISGVCLDRKYIYILVTNTVAGTNKVYKYTTSGDLQWISDDLGSDRRGLLFDGKYLYVVNQGGSPDFIEKHAITTSGLQLVKERRVTAGNELRSLTTDGKYLSAVEDSVNRPIRVYSWGAWRHIYTFDSDVGSRPDGIDLDGKYLFVVD